jgi:hypothetical protein
MGTPIERRAKWTKCGKTIEVRGEKPLDLVYTDKHLIVKCPACDWPNVTD